MSLLETIQRDFIDAMKGKNAEKVATLRMLKSAISYYKIDQKKNTLGDSDVVEILQKQAKQRKESLDSFEKAGRTDLAEKEKRELEFLRVYLPMQLSDQEIKELAQKAIQSSGAKGKQDMGKVMKELMPLVKGRADGKKVNEIVSSLLP